MTNGPTRAQIDALARAREEHYAATPSTADCRRKGEEHKRAYLEIERAFPGWIAINVPDEG